MISFDGSKEQYFGYLYRQSNKILFVQDDHIASLQARIEWRESGLELLHVFAIIFLRLRAILPVEAFWNTQERDEHLSVV